MARLLQQMPFYLTFALLKTIIWD